MTRNKGVLRRVSIDTSIRNVNEGRPTRPGYIIKVLTDLGEYELPGGGNLCNGESRPKLLREEIIKNICENQKKNYLIFYGNMLMRADRHTLYERGGIRR